MDGQKETVPLTREETISEDALYLRHSYEVKWVHYQHYMMENGYSLRPRYHLNWTPSWRGSGAHPADCEDSWAAPSTDEIDATYIRDQQHVSIKFTSTDNGGAQEVEVLQHLSQPMLRGNPQNHAVPFLDTFPVPGDPEMVFIVTPYLPTWDQVPFELFGEVMDFMQQILEGMRFLHSAHIAHRDPVAMNIVMDASSLYSEPFHPANPAFSLDGKRRIVVKPRSQGTVRYYFTNFKLSVRFPSLEDRGLVVGGKELEKRAPELGREQIPYDPFKLDVLTIGFVIKDHVLKKYRGFEKLGPLIEAMTTKEPQERPHADEAFDLYMAWARNQGPVTQSWRLQPFNAGIAERGINTWSSVAAHCMSYFRGLLARFWRWITEFRSWMNRSN